MTKKKETTPDTIITMTFPGEGGIIRTGTILIQRGDIAHIREFTYSNQADIANAIGEATAGLVAVEAAPPPHIETKPGDEYKPPKAETPKTEAKPVTPSAAADTSDDDEDDEDGEDGEDGEEADSITPDPPLHQRAGR